MSSRPGVVRMMGAVAFAAAGASELRNAITIIAGTNHAPVMLALVQLVSTTILWLAAEAIWHRRARAWTLVLAWGAWGGGELLSLQPLLKMDPAGFGSLALGATTILGVCVVIAWRLHRSRARGDNGGRQSTTRRLPTEEG